MIWFKLFTPKVLYPFFRNFSPKIFASFLARSYPFHPQNIIAAPKRKSFPSYLYSPAVKHHRTLAGTHFPSFVGAPCRVGGWVGLGYWIPRCFARPKTITHPSTSCGGRESNSRPSSRKSKALTTRLPSHPDNFLHVNTFVTTLIKLKHVRCQQIISQRDRELLQIKTRDIIKDSDATHALQQTHHICDLTIILSTHNIHRAIKATQLFRWAWLLIL